MKSVIVTYFLLSTILVQGYGQVDSVVANIHSIQNSISIPERNTGKAVSIEVGLNMAMRGFNCFFLEDEYA